MNRTELSTIHLLDFFDVLAFKDKENVAAAIDHVSPGLYPKYNNLRNKLNQEGYLATDKKARNQEIALRNRLKQELDEAIPKALKYMTFTLNPDAEAGLTQAQEQGIRTIIYSTTNQNTTQGLVGDFGIQELIAGYVSPHILTSAADNEAAKLPTHFLEIQRRLQQGEDGGIIAHPGQAVLFVDDKAAYAAAAAATGIRGYRLKPQATSVSETNFALSEQETLDGIISLTPTITVVPRLRDVYKTELAE